MRPPGKPRGCNPGGSIPYVQFVTILQYAPEAVICPVALSLRSCFARALTCPRPLRGLSWLLETVLPCCRVWFNIIYLLSSSLASWLVPLSGLLSYYLASCDGWRVRAEITAVSLLVDSEFVPSYVSGVAELVCLCSIVCLYVAISYSLLRFLIFSSSSSSSSFNFLVLIMPPTTRSNSRNPAPSSLVARDPPATPSV